MRRVRKHSKRYEALLKWKKNNWEKYQAHKRVFVALRNGSMKRSPCVVCGAEKSEAHHEDYSMPLDVIWLCKSHHVEADKRLKACR